MRSPYKMKPTGYQQWTIGYYSSNWRWVAIMDVYDDLEGARIVKRLNK